MKPSFLFLQISNKPVDMEKDSNLLTDDVVTSPQDHYTDWILLFLYELLQRAICWFEFSLANTKPLIFPEMLTSTLAGSSVVIYTYVAHFLRFLFFKRKAGGFISLLLRLNKGELNQLWNDKA